MRANIIGGVLLVLLDLMLTFLSLPYAAQGFMGFAGVASGVVVALSSIKPFLAARAIHAHRAP